MAYLAHSRQKESYSRAEWCCLLAQLWEEEEEKIHFLVLYRIFCLRTIYSIVSKWRTPWVAFNHTVTCGESHWTPFCIRKRAFVSLKSDLRYFLGIMWIFYKWFENMLSKQCSLSSIWLRVCECAKSARSSTWAVHLLQSTACPETPSWR